MSEESTPGVRARPITIAVDAMGGDHAPAAIVEGAAAAADAFGIDVILTGRSAQLRPLLAAQASSRAANGVRRPAQQGNVKISTAEDSLAMDEGALASLRRPRSSAAIACQLVRRGQAQAVVSAGSTGGVVATARLRLRSMPGVMRPGLAVVLPTRPGPTLLVDAGAIADPKPEMLVAFAQLGVAYAQVAYGIAEPRVGCSRLAPSRERATGWLGAPMNCWTARPHTAGCRCASWATWRVATCSPARPM